MSVDPSYTATLLFDSADPDKMKRFVSMIVSLRMDGAPGAVLSSVNVREAVPVLPAASVSLATSVCAPLVRPAGVNDHAPLVFAVVVRSEERRVGKEWRSRWSPDQ